VSPFEGEAPKISIFLVLKLLFFLIFLHHYFLSRKKLSHRDLRNSASKSHSVPPIPSDMLRQNSRGCDEMGGCKIIISIIVTCPQEVPTSGGSFETNPLHPLFLQQKKMAKILDFKIGEHACGKISLVRGNRESLI